MRIAVIGVGRLGSTLARALGIHGHDVVVVSSREVADTAAQVDGWRGVRAVPRDDVVVSDVVVLAVPWARALEALDGLALEGTVVVDATNAFDDDAEPVDAGPRGSTGTLADRLPAARWVKAFNTLPEERYREDAREVAATSRRIGLPIASDDVTAGDEVADLISDVGFTAVPVGGLAAAARLMEPASPLFNVPLPAEELRARLRQLEDG